MGLHKDEHFDDDLVGVGGPWYVWAQSRSESYELRFRFLSVERPHAYTVQGNRHAEAVGCH